MTGLPFFEYLDETNRAIYPIGATYSTLYPVNTALTKEVQEIINNEFYSRFVNLAYPQGWLRRWHLKIKQYDEIWMKLLSSELLLQEKDALNNYDLYETYEESYTGSGTGENKSSTGGTTTYGATQYESDTPDGSVTDIETYMSSASKATQTTSTNDEGTSTSKSEGSGTTSHTLRRYGNIGVMTFQQILQGYRDAIEYNAFRTIFDELDKLFIGVYEEGDGYGYFYSPYQ